MKKKRNPNITVIRQTAKIKLDLKPSDVLPTMQAYTEAFNFCSQTAYDYNTVNPRNITVKKLHNLTYYQTEHLLKPAQLRCSARDKAFESVKSSAKKRFSKCPVSKLCSIRYDCNSYTLFPKTNEASISLLDGSGNSKRTRVKLKVADYYLGLFADWKACSADLVIKKQSVYLHIVFEQEVPKAVPTGRVIGIDRGINNLAVSSDNRFFGGQKVKSVVRKRQFLRTILQKAKSKSAKRHLRKESRREKQFRADINHQISKEIVSSLRTGDIIVLENLKGIRNGSKKFRKKTKTAMNGWSFFQLEQFIIYKAEAKGISVFEVAPQYTSQTCSHCGFCHKNNRHGSKFRCKSCGFQLDADLNGSRNIRDKYLASPTTAEPAGKAIPTVKHPKGKLVASLPQLLSDQAEINQPIVSPAVVI